MKIYVAHSSNFEFKRKLYEPLRKSDLNKAHEIFLPQETGKEEVTRDLIKGCQLVIAEVSLPSTGEGIELGWADIFGIPILCIYEAGTRRSLSLDYVTKNFIEYTDTLDMIQGIGDFIAKQ